MTAFFARKYNQSSLSTRSTYFKLRDITTRNQRRSTRAVVQMSASIASSPFLRKRSSHCPVIGEWTCYRRRDDLMVLLADIASIKDTNPLKDCFSSSLNAFLTLWNQVGYLLSSSEEDLAPKASYCKEHMRLLPYDDAVEFIARHLTREGKLFLKIFNPLSSNNSKATVQTVVVDPLTDEDGCNVEESSEEVNSDASGKSSTNDVDTKTTALRERRASKRGGSSLFDLEVDEGNPKKRKVVNSDFPSLDFHSVKFNDYCPDKDEAFLTFVKTFLEKKEMEKDRLLKQIAEEQKARNCMEEKMKELEVELKKQLDKEEEMRRTKDESIKALQDELQISNSKRKVLEDKLKGIKQFLQVDTDQVDQKIPETKQVEV
ncbi:hypothetical protein P5673_010344 [Acropora cervicornis]|uniref:Uncharacterized protein n=2 Tax=Acropora TaxID=6127 RepID=A0AAD9QRG5_ACRCE|nr:hypothetical protein P5673_010344 [Acropora cervicornis]